MKLYLDLETYSSVDIMASGAYKYTESIDFEILILCYAFNNGPIITIDLAQGDIIPRDVFEALINDEVELHAHNANFERLCFLAYGFNIPIWRWHCSAFKARYCGLPGSLGDISAALQLEEKGKLTTGKALIRFFSCPIKPTKTNGMRVRNFPHHDLEKWDEYKKYCYNDVEAEREIDNILLDFSVPDMERQLYILDQEINDRGILIDLTMANNAVEINTKATKILLKELSELTGLTKPNSPVQLRSWLSSALGKDVPSLTKDAIIDLLESEPDELEGQIFFKAEDLPGLGYSQAALGGWLHSSVNPLDFYGKGETTEEVLKRKNKPRIEVENEIVKQVLELRQKASKTSVKKYLAMLNCACYNNRAHGLFQFYGANRTGRWAGRLIQLQNLPQNHLEDLELLREAVYNNDYELLNLLHDNIPNVLSQLIRTAFIAKTNHTFNVADFSAIEARIIAWLADEQWRLDVFATHGKIYEASAAMMFGMPIESIGKGSPERQKGKVAELALGYQGALGALKKMGGEKMGLSDPEMEEIVRKWRAANPCIVDLWKVTNSCAIQAIKTRQPVVMTKYKNLVFNYEGNCLTIQLPSGRKLFYQDACLGVNKWGGAYVKYKGVDQVTKKWWWVDSYGGKFIENIIQAIARDCLAHSMLELNEKGFEIVMHVHDEVVDETLIETSKERLKEMCYIMGQPIPWAPGLILTADGYTTKFYKKD